MRTGTIARQDYAVMREGLVLFAVLDIRNGIGREDLGFAIGVRASNDKSVAIGLVAELRVLVCDNLALSGDMILLKGRDSAMRRIAASVLVVGVLGATLFFLAAGHEVTSLGSSLTRMARDLRLSAGGSSRSGRPAGAGSARPGAPGAEAPGAEAPGEWRYMEVSFTATEDDLGHVLGRDEAWLGGWLTQTREVSCRLTEGHILIDSRTRVRVLGVPIAAYAGASSWGLAARPDGVGVRLGDLRVSGIAVPGASWLLRRLGKVEEGWVVVRTGSRAVVDRIEVAGGKLTVAGRLRRSVSTGGGEPPPGLVPEIPARIDRLALDRDLVVQVRS